MLVDNMKGVHGANYEHVISKELHIRMVQTFKASLYPQQVLMQLYEVANDLYAYNITLQY